MSSYSVPLSKLSQTFSSNNCIICLSFYLHGGARDYCTPFALVCSRARCTAVDESIMSSVVEWLCVRTMLVCRCVSMLSFVRPYSERYRADVCGLQRVRRSSASLVASCVTPRLDMSSDEEPEEQHELFSFTTVMLVKSQGTNVYFDVKVVDGRKFIYASCTNRKLERIVLAGVGIYKHSKRCKAFADVVKDLTKAKNDQFAELLEGVGVRLNKQRRYTMNDIKPKVLQLPEVCKIPVGGGHIDVLCTKPTVGLWIEALCAAFTLVQTAVIGKLPSQLKLLPAEAEAA
jgi:hypothetical protein